MASDPSDAPTIFVLAGVNGAGKSSVGGARLKDLGRDYFNPDVVAREIRETTGCSLEEANSQAWQEGKRRLEQAIRARRNFAFESTLGAHTMPAILTDAARQGFRVVVWFVGLSSPEKHIERVRLRVEAGGHDIPEAKIRDRWNTSRQNIIDLLPSLEELKVFDNSADRDPVTGELPPPRLLLHWRNGAVVESAAEPPEWAKPILDSAHALERQRKG
ncbi:MAG: zeta toxin family protein [Acidobacteria bacterium]|nr:zeta toxin family protein [Acidobacteriota bacterium]MBV9474906.1 zeta toxin family protein [Acidobacteriota bacterium]